MRHDGTPPLRDRRIRWANALQPVAGTIAAAGDWLRAEVAAGRRYLPAGNMILRAFTSPSTTSAS